MAVPYERARLHAMHPIHAILLAGSVPLFAGALLADIAYWKTQEIQWSNFASWLLAGGLVFCGIALVAALVALVRADRRGGRQLLYFLLVLATWVLGFIDALVHAKDAWAVMPAGLVLSLIVAALACSAKWIAFAGLPWSRVRTEVAP